MKKTLISRFVILLTMPLAVIATSATAETRYFIDGMFGQADQKNTIGGFDAISGSDTSAGIRMGFYLNSMLGVEFTHVDYGVAEDDFVDSFGDIITNTLDTRMTGVGLQGVLPLGQKVHLIGRLGVAAWDVKFTEEDSSVPGVVYRDKSEGSDAYFGLGLRFDIEDNVRIAVEYENMDYEAALGAANTDHSVHNIGVSLGVLF